MEASSIDDALDKVQKMYDEEEIVLDHNDYICTKIGLLKVD
ncbi:MAG: DpnD/PcfM family protein [Elusimicrobiota bacterium]